MPTGEKGSVSLERKGCGSGYKSGGFDYRLYWGQNLSGWSLRTDMR